MATLPEPGPKRASRVIRLWNFSLTLPASRFLRVSLGVLLVIGGFLGFLPVLGFWMIPLGVLVLSVDLHPVRRLRRRFDVMWGRRKKPGNKQQP